MANFDTKSTPESYRQLAEVLREMADVFETIDEQSDIGHGQEVKHTIVLSEK